MKKVKRYLLFVSEQYYPNGFDDYRGSHDSIVEAREAADKHTSWAFSGFYEIVEHSTMALVESGFKDGHWKGKEWIESDWKIEGVSQEKSNPQQKEST